MDGASTRMVYDQDVADVAAEELTRVRRGAIPEAKFWGLSLEQLGGRLLKEGLFSKQQIEATQQLLDNPNFVYTEATAGWCGANVVEEAGRRCRRGRK